MTSGEDESGAGEAFCEELDNALSREVKERLSEIRQQEQKRKLKTSLLACAEQSSGKGQEMT